MTMTTAAARPRPQHVILLVSTLVLVADQITKAICVATVQLHSRTAILEGILDLTHVRNSGMAFGLFGGVQAAWLRWVLVAVAVLAVLIIWSYARHESGNIGVLIAFGAILGGARGNLVDRLRFGYVVDFVLVHWGPHEWPAFNVADSAITIGGLALFLTLARGNGESRTRNEPEQPVGKIPAEASDIGPDRV